MIELFFNSIVVKKPIYIYMIEFISVVITAYLLSHFLTTEGFILWLILIPTCIIQYINTVNRNGVKKNDKNANA